MINSKENLQKALSECRQMQNYYRTLLEQHQLLSAEYGAAEINLSRYITQEADIIKRLKLYYAKEGQECLLIQPIHKPKQMPLL